MLKFEFFKYVLKNSSYKGSATVVLMDFILELMSLVYKPIKCLGYLPEFLDKMDTTNQAILTCGFPFDRIEKAKIYCKAIFQYVVIQTVVCLVSYFIIDKVVAECLLAWNVPDILSFVISFWVSKQVKPDILQSIGVN